MKKTSVFMNVSLTEEQLEFLGREGRAPARQLSLDLDILRLLLEQCAKGGNRQLIRALEKAKAAVGGEDSTA